MRLTNFENYECLLKADVRPFFGHRLTQEISRSTHTGERRAEGVTDTTINRELSKVSQAFKVGKRLGKIYCAPLGGCDFMKDPERKNTQLVRLPDRYFGFLRYSPSSAPVCLCCRWPTEGPTSPDYLGTGELRRTAHFLPVAEELSAKREGPVLWGNGRISSGAIHCSESALRMPMGVLLVRRGATRTATESNSSAGCGVRLWLY